MDNKSKIMRKPDPTKRKDIHVATLERIKKFLQEQKLPIFKTEIVRQIGVDYNSLNIALNILPIETDEEGKIKMKGKKGGN